MAAQLKSNTQAIEGRLRERGQLLDSTEAALDTSVQVGAGLGGLPARAGWAGAERCLKKAQEHMESCSHQCLRRLYSIFPPPCTFRVFRRRASAEDQGEQGAGDQDPPQGARQLLPHLPGHAHRGPGLRWCARPAAWLGRHGRLGPEFGRKGGPPASRCVAAGRAIVAETCQALTCRSLSLPPAAAMYVYIQLTRFMGYRAAVPPPAAAPHAAAMPPAPPEGDGAAYIPSYEDHYEL